VGVEMGESEGKRVGECCEVEVAGWTRVKGKKVESLV
jgi:hypothetical protein